MSDPLFRVIEGQYEQFVRDLETIVNIDSSSDLLSGIEAVAAFFQKRLAALGFEIRIQHFGDAGVPCLEAVNKPGDDSFDVMFLGHMDTVFPPGEVAGRPFSISGNKAFGPGVCDMKGGLLVALHALEALHAAGLLNSLNVCVGFNGDEEIGSPTSRPWIRSLAQKSRRVFVFEPCRPGYRFVLCRKGGGWFHVTASGTAAHAGADPHKGANAVVELAHQVIAITGLNDPDTGTTAQVTVINGGDKINIIPALASASVDIRIEKRAQKERVETFFKDLPGNITVPGVTVSVEGSIDHPPMEPDSNTMALWEIIRKTAENVGIETDYIATGGYSDGNYTSAEGTPTIDGMGLVGSNSHRHDEYVELDAVVPMVRIVAGVCRAIIK
ncbi:M20 family metallopeptidase [Desulfobacter hydrogenophilus]|nr:M20 family metallopeptidase [Desulfobacter hydrogenophilus]NDY71511.1 M20 family metallopeptidase [Desulfobacter hydrogenophilus]